MNIYIFDGSFEGFLTCIYHSYYDDIKPNNIIVTTNYIPNLIDSFVNIITDLDKSSKVYTAMENTFTNETIKNIMHVFLSNNEEKYWILHNYIRLAFKFKKDVDMYLNNDTILKISKISRNVKLEAHRFTGFVRFKDLGNNKFYASIEPDNNILILIASHFTHRFKNQSFIIHDIKRELALIYDGEKYFIDFFSKTNYELANKINDMFFEDLWKAYYTSASIQSRKNPKLQHRQMPKRYWKYLIETN
ncbi:TIGR03915 family putative DNA repair protein [Clostridium senegalense]|uniref:TIGR03915 family putative DNA repair protein n=1 Tax=Clostridium senegalense TaxID=1465809 RepID=UPI000287EA1B|nr:TIGR03915 family putative DNA repair protein [Clostridium senegalense]